MQNTPLMTRSASSTTIFCESKDLPRNLNFVTGIAAFPTLRHGPPSVMAGPAGQALKRLDNREEMKGFLTGLAHKLPR